MSESLKEQVAAEADALDLAKAMTEVQLEAAKEIVASIAGKDGAAPDPALIGQVAQTIAINHATVIERQGK